MPKPFTPSRDDGRSDRQVVFELVRDASPETVFPFVQIRLALQDGVENTITQQRVCAAARLADKTLQRECDRVLRVVKGVGYRVAPASEHLGMALVRKDKATMQFRQGVDILRHCRLGELSETERKLHEGNLLVMTAYLSALRHLNARQDRQERVLEVLTKRIDKLEGTEAIQAVA